MLYQLLTEENFHSHSLDGFIRRQEVAECWRKRDGQWKLLPIAYVEDWSLEDRRRRAESILQCVKDGGLAYGAWEGERLIGFAQLSGPRFGSRNQYIDLARFHVSEPFRRQGIGKELFRLACKGARELGAEKLYISAHSAVETQAFYRGLGCVDAQLPDPRHMEAEPFDCQLEYTL